MNKKIVLVMSFLAVYCFGQTVYGDITLPPGAFLWLIPDARTDALGGAITASLSHTNAGWANPSAICEIEPYSAGISYSYLRSSTSYSTFFGATRSGKWAGSARFFLINTGDIEARSGPTSEPDYIFSAHQLYAQFSIAREIKDFLDLGASAKWIHERIDMGSRSGWVFDLGISGGYEFIHAGISVQNWGQEVVFRMFREYYPITYRAGISCKVADYGTISADWIKPDLMSGWSAIGAEIDLPKNTYIRLGYTPLHDTRNISAGIGARIKSLCLDYSLVNYSQNLGISHQITLSYNPVKK